MASFSAGFNMFAIAECKSRDSFLESSAEKLGNPFLGSYLWGKL